MSVAEGARVLTFRVGSKVLAVRSDLVRRVAMRPAVTRVPYAPKAFEGLANLQGEIMPVVSVAAALDEPGTADHGRLIVLGGDEPAALAVDTVERLGVDDGAAELVDPANLVAALLAHAPAERRAARPPGARAAPMARGEQVAVLEFAIGNETYGLPIDAVVEVTDAPDQLTRWPDADPSILGAAVYRNSVLPVVSAAGLLGWAHGRGEGAGRMIVARAGPARVGLLVDRPRGILRADRSHVDAPPALLNRAEAQARIEAVIRAPGRLVAVVRPEALLRSDAVAGLAEQSAPEAKAAAPRQAGEGLLVFRLGSERYALPSSRIEAVVRLSAHVARLPNLPGLMAGVTNHRGEALVLVEPAVSFNAQASDARKLVIVVRGADQRFGLVVEAVEDVVRVDDRFMAAGAEAMSNAMSVFPVAVVTGEADQPLLVVDVTALETLVARDLEALRREAPSS